MTAKMNLLASTTMEILIWNCPTPSYPFTHTSIRVWWLWRTVVYHATGALTEGVSTFWVGQRKWPAPYGESSPFSHSSLLLISNGTGKCCDCHFKGIPVLSICSLCFNVFPWLWRNLTSKLLRAATRDTWDLSYLRKLEKRSEKDNEQVIFSFCSASPVLV